MKRQKKDGKFFQAAHIKRNTEGTSNELSFSILDAARKAADKEIGLDPDGKAPHFGKVSLFTLPKKKSVPTPYKQPALPSSVDDMSVYFKDGTTTSPSSAPVSFEIPAGEVASRKAKRKQRNRFAVLLFVVALASFLGIAGFWAYGELTKYQNDLSTVEQSLELIATADETILSLDSLLSVDINMQSNAQYESIQEKLPDTEVALSQADELARQATETMRDSTGKEAAVQAISGIEARRAMIVIGSQLMDEGLAAFEASHVIEEAWQTLLDADATAREADGLIADPTPENIEASKEKSAQAKALFGQSLTLYHEADTLYPSADYGIQKDYLAKRMESMDYAITTDDALLAFNKEEALIQNDAYSAADAEASEMAKRFADDDPLKQLNTAYDKNTEDDRRAYEEAREKASTVDAFLRNYLGTGSK